MQNQCVFNQQVWFMHPLLFMQRRPTLPTLRRVTSSLADVTRTASVIETDANPAPLQSLAVGWAGMGRDTERHMTKEVVSEWWGSTWRRRACRDTSTRFEWLFKDRTNIQLFILCTISGTPAGLGPPPKWTLLRLIQAWWRNAMRAASLHLLLTHPLMPHLKKQASVVGGCAKMEKTSPWLQVKGKRIKGFSTNDTWKVKLH